MLQEFLHNFEHNLFKPLLLFFYFGFLLPLLKLDFEFPYVIYQGLTMYLLLAGLATPLVLSVHTVVSFDFAVGIVPGWHTTIFPPYFVAGAIYAGFAMVLLLAIPLRKMYGVEDFITMRHLENMAKITLVTGLIVWGMFELAASNPS